jgi:ATP-binding cassette subfamily F protein uup
MDKIVDHLFVFEGEGKIKDFPGTYTEYRLWHKSQKSNDAFNVAEQEKNRTEKPRERKNRLSYKEQKEFDALEVEIPALQREKAEIESTFASGEALSAERVNTLSSRMEEVIALLEEKEERWLELSMMMED